MPTKHFELVLDSTWRIVRRKCLNGERLWEDIKCTDDKPKHNTWDQEGRAKKLCGLDNLCYRPSYAGANNVSPQLPTTIVTSLTLSNAWYLILS